MKNKIKLILVALVTLGIVGCATYDKQQTCQAAVTAYAIYLAILAADGNPTEDQCRAAEAARIFLVTYCNWTVDKSPKYDKCGLSIINPPHR